MSDDEPKIVSPKSDIIVVDAMPKRDDLVALTQPEISNAILEDAIRVVRESVVALNLPKIYELELAIAKLIIRAAAMPAEVKGGSGLELLDILEERLTSATPGEEVQAGLTVGDGGVNYEAGWLQGRLGISMGQDEINRRARRLARLGYRKALSSVREADIGNYSLAQIITTTYQRLAEVVAVLQHIMSQQNIPAKLRGGAVINTSTN